MIRHWFAFVPKMGSGAPLMQVHAFWSWGWERMVAWKYTLIWLMICIFVSFGLLETCGIRLWECWLDPLPQNIWKSNRWCCFHIQVAYITLFCFSYLVHVSYSGQIGHPKWWFRILNSGLGITGICPEYWMSLSDPGFLVWLRWISAFRIAGYFQWVATAKCRCIPRKL